MDELNTVFIDTNIWFYAFTEKDIEKHRLATKLIKEFEKSIIISIQVINELCFSLKKKTHIFEKEI